MFKIIKEDKGRLARIGLFESNNGEVETPSFFPVATQAAIKGLSPKALLEIGIEGILVNAYHLYLRPGIEVIKECAGLHRFMGYPKTIITDSGGYQIFSLEKLRKVNDEGVVFQSHIDGKTIFLSPEEIIKIQLDLDSDVVVPLDECIRPSASYQEAKSACERTIRWAKLSKDFFLRYAKGALFFGIVQGSVYPDLRKRCLEELMNLELDGVCLGGLSVGETPEVRYNILSLINTNLDKKYLRYFMGYGKPPDILEAVSLGIDLFDCVIPTRLGRTGTAFTDQGELVIRNAPYTFDQRPIDEDCSCYVCRNFCRAYLRHLINVHEILGIELLSYHNLYWYKNFMERIKKAIKEERFNQFKQEFLCRYQEK